MTFREGNNCFRPLNCRVIFTRAHEQKNLITFANKREAMYEGSREKVKVEPRPTARLSATLPRIFSILFTREKFTCVYTRVKITRPPFMQVRKERPEKKFRLVSDLNY